jgi:hypothetical protein
VLTPLRKTPVRVALCGVGSTIRCSSCLCSDPTIRRGRNVNAHLYPLLFTWSSSSLTPNLVTADLFSAETAAFQSPDAGLLSKGGGYSSQWPRSIAGRQRASAPWRPSVRPPYRSLRSRARSQLRGLDADTIGTIDLAETCKRYRRCSLVLAEADQSFLAIRIAARSTSSRTDDQNQSGVLRRRQAARAPYSLTLQWRKPVSRSRRTDPSG